MTNGEATRKLIRNLLEAQISFRQAIHKRLKNNKFNLTFEMLQIMVILWRQDGINQQGLAARTFKDKASLTSLLNNLEGKGLVARVEDTHDRRNNNIMLTELGKQYGEQIEPLLVEIFDYAGQRMNREHVNLTTQYLRELNEAFKEE